MPLIRQTATLALAAACLAWTPPGQAMPRPTDEQLQSWAHAELDGPIPWQIAPFEPGPEAVKVGHQLLDALWEMPGYRNHLHAWLDANAAAAVSADELLTTWEHHYHDAFGKGFEFQNDTRTQLLWLVGGAGIDAALPRDFCESKSRQELERLRADAARGALAKMGGIVVKAVSTTLVHEFEREDGKWPPADAGEAQTMAKVSQLTLRVTMASLPEDDAKRLYNRFAYGAPAASPQEACEREWVAANAVMKTQLSDLPKGISSGLLRQSVAQAEYMERFMRLDRNASALPVNGFDAGKTSFHLPTIMTRNMAHGVTDVVLHVDADGHYTGATLVKSTLSPDPLKTVDNATTPAADALLAALDTYLRGGSFRPAGDGKPRDVAVAFHWN